MTSRSITGLVLAVLLALPAAAQAQSRTGSGIWLGGMFGLEAGQETGAQLRLDGEVPIARFTTSLQLAGVATLSYAFLSHDTNVFEAVPSARLNWAATRTFGGYGDIGLGLFHASWKKHGDSHGDTGATMRYMVGAYYEMNPSVRFVGEAGVHPHYGDYDDTTFTLMIGAKFRI